MSRRRDGKGFQRVMISIQELSGGFSDRNRLQVSKPLPPRFLGFFWVEIKGRKGVFLAWNSKVLKDIHRCRFLSDRCVRHCLNGFLWAGQ